MTPAWTPPAWIVNSAVVAAIVGVVGTVLVALIRAIGPWRAQIDELEQRMREELRLDKLRCEAELKVVKHRERRNRQLIYSMLHIIDLPADRRGEMVSNIRNELASIEQAEALESAAASAACLGGSPE